MSISRREVLKAGAGMLAAAVAGSAVADDYPSKPIRIIVAQPSGTGLDADTRLWAAGLSAALGQSVVVENRPGAATTIGTSIAARAAPDGYTLLMGIPASLCYMPELYAKVPYKVSDFEAISQLTTLRCSLIAHPAMAATTAAEFVTLSKANPGALNAGTQGVGSFQHLLGEWFASVTGSRVSFIPYATTSPYLALMGGQVHATFDAVAAAVTHMKAGKLKVLGISGQARHAGLPDIPTFEELGIQGYDPSTWFGLLAPAGTPQPVIAKLAAACASVARKSDIVQRYRDYGGESLGSSPSEFSAFIRAERSKWVAAVKRSGLKLELPA
jgi:tripartite-type tricarboxylate transporter receptor subunit TctC